MYFLSLSLSSSFPFAYAPAKVAFVLRRAHFFPFLLFWSPPPSPVSCQINFGHFFARPSIDGTRIAICFPARKLFDYRALTRLIGGKLPNPNFDRFPPPMNRRAGKMENHPTPLKLIKIKSSWDWKKSEAPRVRSSGKNNTIFRNNLNVLQRRRNKNAISAKFSSF